MDRTLESGIPTHIISEPGGLKELIVELYSNGYISNPKKGRYGSVASWERVIGNEGNGIDNTFLVRRREEGIEIQLEVTNPELFGELAAISIERMVDFDREEPQQVREAYVFPLYERYVTILVPHLASGNTSEETTIRFPLKPLSLDNLSNPLFKSIIKKSRRELREQEDMNDGWFKFVQKHGSQLPSHIRGALQETASL